MSQKFKAAGVVDALMTKMNFIRLVFMASVLLVFAPKSFADVQTTVEYHAEAQESTSLTFTNIPSPSRNDCATEAKFTIVSGEADVNSGGLERLHDGKLPAEADEPTQNFFLPPAPLAGEF